MLQSHQAGNFLCYWINPWKCKTDEKFLFLPKYQKLQEELLHLATQVLLALQRSYLCFSVPSPSQSQDEDLPTDDILSCIV